MWEIVVDSREWKKVKCYVSLSNVQMQGRRRNKVNIAKGTTDPRVEFISQVPHKS